MNCINCFHYAACASVDVTGYVRDAEQDVDICEHFIREEDIHPIVDLVEIIRDYGSDSDIFVLGVCPNCHNKIYIKSYKRKDWDEYYKEHHSIDCLDKYCSECGAKIVKEKENGTS